MNHRSIRIPVFAAIAAAALAPTAVAGQSINEALSEMAEDNGTLYLQPVFEGLGTALNPGFVESADVHGQLGFDVGVRAVGSLVPDERRTFDAVIPSRVEVTFGGETHVYQGEDLYAPAGESSATPTAAGEGSGVTLVPSGELRDDLQAAGEDPDDPRWAIQFPRGYDLPAVPLAVIEGSVGLGFNTEVTLRLIPSVEVSPELGSVGAFGAGAQHELTGWLPGPAPVDVSAFAGYQDVAVGEYIDASTTTLGLAAGKGFGPLHAYVVGKRASPSVRVTYAVDNPKLPIHGQVLDFSPRMEPEIRYGLGVNWTLLVMQLSAQYTKGSRYDVLSLKAGVSFR